MHRHGLLLILLALLAGAVPASADAAAIGLVYQRSDPGSPGDGRYFSATPPIDVYTLQVTDSAGVANGILVDGVAGVRDTAGPLALGDGCTVSVSGWATCTPPARPGHDSLVVLAIDTGGGDDLVSLVAAASRDADVPTLDLGDGDDRVEVTRGRWRVRGGAGSDALTTTAPDPWLDYYYNRGTAGDWHGVVWDGGPGADSAGGPSVLVTYAGRAAGVRVTPGGAADDGEPGEDDNVAADVGGVIGGDGADELHSSGHIVEGGPGDDRLVGADADRPAKVERDGVMQRSELLDGGDGNDVVAGGGGADQVQGGAGDDVVDGGPGDDVIDGGSGADHVTGGEGDDITYSSSYPGLVPDGASDVWEGGPGTDTMSLGRSPGPAVDVTLDGHADDGLPGEGDNVASDWERLTIGSGRLVGDDGPNTLIIEANGSVDGRGGDDLLVGGNTLVGGPGRDVLEVSGYLADTAVQGTRIDITDGERDEVHCGDRMRVVRLLHDRADRVRGCFSLSSVSAGVLRGSTTHDRAWLTVDVYCYGHQRCRGTITVRAGRGSSRVVGRARIDARADPRNPRHQRFRVRLRRPPGVPSSCGTLRATVRIVSPFDPREVRETVSPVGPCHWARGRR